MAFFPKYRMMAVDWENVYGSVPTLSLKVSNCCLTAAGLWRFTKTYSKLSLSSWRKGVERSITDAIGLILTGVTDAKGRAALVMLKIIIHRTPQPPLDSTHACLLFAPAA